MSHTESESSHQKLIEPEFNQTVYNRCKIKIIMLGLPFMLLFSAFNSAQNLVSSLYNNHPNLGTVSLLVIYSVFGLSSFLANEVIQKFSYKTLFVGSSFGYIAYVGSGIWVCLCDGTTSDDEPLKHTTGICQNEVIWAIVLFGAALCGYSASLIWIAQGGYVDSVCLETPQKKAALTGIFWSLMQGSQLIGSIIGTFVLNLLSSIAYFLIMTGFGIAAAFLFLALPTVNKVQVDPRFKQPLSVQIKNVIDLLISPSTRYFLPVIMLGGVVVSFYSSFLSTLVSNSIDGSDNVSNKLSYTLICLGAFEVGAGLFMSKFGDKFNRYQLATISTLNCLVGILVSFVGLFTDNYFVCFVIASIWGFSDCFINAVNQTIANKDFPGSIEIYQVLRFSLSWTCALFYVIKLLLENSPPYIYLVIVMSFTIITNFCCSKLGKNQEETTKSEEHQLLPD